VEKETRWNSGAPMRDSERQTLCAELRRLPSYFFTTGIKAADEIERLTKTNERLSNALWAAGVKWEIVEAMIAGPQSNASEAEESPDGSADYIPIGGAGNGA
jgi:hypothetical protein